MLPSVITALLLLLVGQSLRAIYRFLIDPLWAVPGPFATRLTRFWELSKVHRGDFQKTNILLHDLYGIS